MGWGPWHGAARVGIFGRAGMGLKPVGSLPDTAPGNAAGGARSWADGSKLPKGGSWGRDSQGNPVPIGPDGQALGPDGQPTRLQVRKANADLHAALQANRTLMQGGNTGFLGAAQVNPEGSVTVNLHGFPQDTRSSTAADGFFKDIKVNRGHAMSVASESD